MLSSALPPRPSPRFAGGGRRRAAENPRDLLRRRQPLRDGLLRARRERDRALGARALEDRGAERRGRGEVLDDREATAVAGSAAARSAHAAAPPEEPLREDAREGGRE